MKILNSLFSLVLSFFVAKLFFINIATNSRELEFNNPSFWVGSLFGSAVIILNIIGQIKYAKLKENDNTRNALAMMYSSIPLLSLYLAFVFIYIIFINP